MQQRDLSNISNDSDGEWPILKENDGGTDESSWDSNCLSTPTVVKKQPNQTNVFLLATVNSNRVGLAQRKLRRDKELKTGKWMYTRLLHV